MQVYSAVVYKCFTRKVLLEFKENQFLATIMCVGMFASELSCLLTDRISSSDFNAYMIIGAEEIRKRHIFYKHIVLCALKMR